MMEGAMSNYGGMYLDPVYAQRKPTPADNQYRIDQEWVDGSVAPHVVYKLVHIDWTTAPYPATWIPIGGSKLSLYEVTDPDTTLTASTQTAADDLVTTAAAHGVRNGQGLQFAAGLLPPELPPSPAVVYAVNVGLLTMQVALVPGGAPINFSVNGTGDFNTVNGATSTPIVDFYDGSIITNTAATPDQTLEPPTDPTPGKTFIVNNDQSSTDPVNVIYEGTLSVTLRPGQGQKFIWDGAKWVLGAGLDADDVDWVPHGEVVDLNVQDAINTLIDIRWQKRFYNATGGILAANKVVKLNGYDVGSTEAFIVPVTSTADVPCGFLTAAIGIAATGYGLIKGEHISVLDTSAGAINDPVYFTAAGDLTLIPGSAVVGRVLTVGNPGTVYIDIPANATSGKLAMTTSTDPALNGIDITFIDPFDGVVVTLTAAGNSQTLPAPTDTTAGKEFVVIGNDTNGSFSLPVVYAGGTVYVHASEAVCFVWDGSAWAISQDAMFTDNGEYLTPKSTDRTIQAASTARVVTRTESGVIPAATTYTDIGLVVVAGHTVKDASVTAVNMALVARKVRIAHVAVGGAVNPPDTSAFVCYDFEMDPDSCLGWNIPTIHAGEVIIVYADGADVTFRISGNDIAAVKSDQVSRLSIGAALSDIFTATAGRHIEELKIVNRDVTDTVVTVYAKEAAAAAAVDAICRFEIPGELWVTLRDLETNNIHLANAQKLSAIAAAAGRINIIVYAK